MGKLEDAQRDRVVVGLKDISPKPVNRQDIDWLLLHEPDAFNVFIIALWELQQDEQSSNWMAYYQLAGIHGLPKAYWDGVKADNEGKEKTNLNESGYCSHGTLNFGPWHRPYLAVLEQTIYSKMIEVAARYPEGSRQRYNDAIKQWRLPYWDYHRPRGGAVTFPGVVDGNGSTDFAYHVNLPKIFEVKSLMVRTTAEDKLELFPNPLASFKFPPEGNPTRILDEQWNNVAHGKLKTMDRDRTNRWANDLNGLNSKLNQMREEEVEYIMNIMSENEYGSYRVVGDQSWTKGKGASGSLEGIHGSYHDYLGGDVGHMGKVAVAAFDPVFWIHHCQVDRWFAIWQAIHPKETHPESWFLDGDKEERARNLLPFRTSRNPDLYWKADSVYETTVFGYSYPDLDPGDPAKVLKGFQDKYEWSYRQAKKREEFGPIPPDMIPWVLTGAQVYDYLEGSPENSILPPLLAPTAKFNLMKPKEWTTLVTDGTKVEHAKDVDPKERAFVNLDGEVVRAPSKTSVDENVVWRQWFVDILVERLALNGEFGTYFFLGDFNDNPSTYGTQATFAGEIYVFAAPVEACDNCGRQNEQALLISDTVPITPMLLDYKKIGQLESLGAADVVQFLKKQLKWRIVNSFGEMVDPRSIASLKIGISSKATDINTHEVTFEEYPSIVEEIIKASS